jgi:hypothetical protein
MVATAHHSNLTLVSPNPEADIARAIELWEQANETLLDAARIFANVKEQTQRKFNKLLESAAVEKSQVSKLIKAADSADEIPSSVVPKLGLPMLLQLGQSRNQAARDAIAHDDTQLLVAQKIKELRPPTEPKDERPVRFVGKKGRGKLRIEVPESPKAVELEKDWVDSGLPPLEWLSRRVTHQTPKQHQELIAIVPKVEQEARELLAGSRGEGSGEVESPPYRDTLLRSEGGGPMFRSSPRQGEGVISPRSLPPSPCLFVEDALKRETQLLDEFTKAQLELNEYIQNQTDEIAPDKLQGNPKDIEVGESTSTTQNYYPQATSTERYKQGWKVGEQAIANGVGGQHFVNWCEGKAVTVESVRGKVGEIQNLNVRRHDGQTTMSFGNWIEEVPALAKSSTAEVLQTATPDYAQLSKALKKAKNWEKITLVVERDANTLTAVTQQWLPEQKEVLLNHVVSYLEAHPKAIMSHEVDWLGIEFLEQIFSKLSFRVRDISEGLAADWQMCEFVSVINFGQDDDEVWTFNVAEQLLKAYSRDDFEIVNF